MEQKVAQLEKVQETLAKQKLEMENMRIKEMRRKSVEEGGLAFKAKPIVTKDAFPTKPVVAAPPTTPFSPKLLTKERSSMKNYISGAAATTTSVSMSIKERRATTSTATTSFTTSVKTLSTTSTSGLGAAERVRSQQLEQALSSL